MSRRWCKSLLGAKVLPTVVHFRRDIISLLQLLPISEAYTCQQNELKPLFAGFCALRVLSHVKVRLSQAEKILGQIVASYNYDIGTLRFLFLLGKLSSVNDTFLNHIAAHQSYASYA